MNCEKIWQMYEKNKQYLQTKGLVKNTERNWNFYGDNQWVGVKTKEELPMLNIIKPTIKYKVSTVCQHAMTAKFTDMGDDSANQHIYDVLNKKFAQSWEKAKMNSALWKCIKASAIQGDSYLYWGTDSTLDTPQLIDNTNILLGNENTTNIQEQPYIMIMERLPLETVKRIALENKVPKEEIDKIRTDAERENQIANKEEVSDKVTCVIYLSKDKDDVITVTRATKESLIEPTRRITSSVDGKEFAGLTLYPIQNFVWEPRPNNARGVSEVASMIPNQIELNKTLARRAVTVKISAFPRIAYDADAVENPDDLNKVGAAIGVRGNAQQSINQMIGYINAANISSDADKLFADLITQTRELAGAGDFAVGNIDPQRSSGSAIIAIRDQAQIPLNEQINTFQQTVEDIALMWFDMWLVYDIDSFTTKDEHGKEIKISADELLDFKPSVKVDVSQDNQWTKFAQQQACDALLAQGQITFGEYAELIPDGGAISKGKLLNLISKRSSEAKIEPQILEDNAENAPTDDIPIENHEMMEEHAEMPTENTELREAQ